MKQFIDNFRKYLYLLSQLVKKNIKLRYRRSYLGMLWTLIEPLLTMIVCLWCLEACWEETVPIWHLPEFRSRSMF